MGMVVAPSARGQRADCTAHDVRERTNTGGVGTSPRRHRLHMAGPALGHASAKMRPARSRSVKTAACTAALGRATAPSCRGISRSSVSTAARITTSSCASHSSRDKARSAQAAWHPAEAVSWSIALGRNSASRFNLDPVESDDWSRPPRQL